MRFFLSLFLILLYSIQGSTLATADDQLAFVRRADGKLGLARLSEAGVLSPAQHYWARGNISTILGRPHANLGRISLVATSENDARPRLILLNGRSGEVLRDDRLASLVHAMIGVHPHGNAFIAIQREDAPAFGASGTRFVALNHGTGSTPLLSRTPFELEQFIAYYDGLAYFQSVESGVRRIHEVNVLTEAHRVAFSLPEVATVSDIAVAPRTSPIFGAAFITLKPSFIEAPEHVFLAAPRSGAAVSPEHHLWRFTNDIEDGALRQMDRIGNYWMITKHPRNVLHRIDVYRNTIASVDIAGSGDAIVALAGIE